MVVVVVVVVVVVLLLLLLVVVVVGGRRSFLLVLGLVVPEWERARERVCRGVVVRCGVMPPPTLARTLCSLAFSLSLSHTHTH